MLTENEERTLRQLLDKALSGGSGGEGQITAEERFFIEVDSLLSYLCHNRYTLTMGSRDQAMRESAEKLYQEARILYSRKPA